MSDIRFNSWLHQSGTGGVHQDGSGNIGIGTTQPVGKLEVAGSITANSFIGNLTGQISGIQTSIAVGDSFINPTSIGIGATTTTGRNAGVSTAQGTLIFNSDNKRVELWTGTSWSSVGGGDFVEATGGTISEYNQNGVFYRAHIFTSSGTLSVTAAPTTNNTVDYLVVGGGAGGGNNAAGGGGAGGFRTGTGLPVSATPGSYTVTVGSGGRAINANGFPGSDGNISSFNNITSEGGGAGGGLSNQGNTGGSGGGGGGWYYSPIVAIGGTGNRVAGTNTNTFFQGYPGGNGNGAPGPGIAAGGGGGALGVGLSALNSVDAGAGGPGALSAITGISTAYAGGGGGGCGFEPTAITPAVGGIGGGGNGGSKTIISTDGLYSTGGGGGGGGNGTSTLGGDGGSGIVVVRYPIGGSVATAKATGGAISYYNGRTIHTFTGSGTFTNTSGSSLSVEYVAIAGGGGGGTGGSGVGGGGGGAGGVVTNIPGMMPATTPQPAVGTGAPNALTVTVGAGAATVPSADNLSGNNGNDTTIAGPGPWSVTAYKGGGGGGNTAPVQTGTFGSGGGGEESNGPAGPSTSGQGNPGGTGSEPFNAGGGGGGAGGAGENAGPGSNGDGGIGVRLPSIFHDPASAPGPGTGPQVGGGLGSPGPAGGYYVAGGGGTLGASPTGPYPIGVGGYGGGGAAISPYGGTSLSNGATSGLQNTGGGGGSSNNNTTTPSLTQGGGGSGIVIIAYPS
jgi:hypothetical protein